MIDWLLRLFGRCSPPIHIPSVPESNPEPWRACDHCGVLSSQRIRICCAAGMIEDSYRKPE